MAKPEIKTFESRIPGRLPETGKESLPSYEQAGGQRMQDAEPIVEDRDTNVESPIVSGPPIIAPPAAYKSQLQKQVELIMQQDLADFYRSMDSETRQRFKHKGTQTAKQIEVLLLETKVKTKKIFDLIVQWLKMIPGVSIFFLKQEAKIKTDKIL